jgi:hypothetical protein
MVSLVSTPTQVAVLRRQDHYTMGRDRTQTANGRGPQMNTGPRMDANREWTRSLEVQDDAAPFDPGVLKIDKQGQMQPGSP